jgi:APA family basic amino acid/polyamine antiporter
MNAAENRLSGDTAAANEQTGTLRRDLGLWGAVVTGLGSIVGTGVFVSIAVAFGLFGREVLLAVPLAAVVATFNGLSSAQLAAAHPVSGGTYEYGYRFLSPWWGFTAGWLFLIAKTASASTAALGFAGYLGALLGLADSARFGLAIGSSVLITALILTGIRRTAVVNAVLIAVTLGSLTTFVVAGWVDPVRRTFMFVPPPEGFGSLLGATAFLFVAYTGYGRIATLGEEVRDPASTIPKAIVTTLVVSAVVYFAVALTAWDIAGAAAGMLDDAAPLAELVAEPWAQIVEIGAIVAMLGVLLNLILGLSRVWLAMGRRRDMPAALGGISKAGSPTAAVLLTGVVVGAVALVGDVRATWSFSAFAVLLYYAITNAAALRLTDEQRRFPRWTSWAGLASCAFLSFWVDPATWAVGAGVLALGLAYRFLRTRVG